MPGQDNLAASSEGLTLEGLEAVHAALTRLLLARRREADRKAILQAIEDAAGPVIQGLKPLGVPK